MKLLTTYLLSFFINSYGQVTDDNLLGTYASTKNKYERWSVMTLSSNNRFVYTYGVGGCQADITGKWWIENSRIKFANDTEFTESYLKSQKSSLEINDTLTIDMPTPYYPDLSQVDWIFKKDYIKPIDKIEAGCLTESAKHKKK